MEDDYYSLLNLDRKCEEEEIKGAYRRQSRLFHPDRHCDANKEAAELNFQKIKRAYEVLIDPQMRTIYDLYGVEGVDSGQHLALYDMDKNKIKETFERIQRQTKEKEQEAATNPLSNIAVELDASGLCYSNRDTYITELFNIPINSFSISQSVDAPLTESNRATVICTAINSDDISTGLIQTNVRHTISNDTWLESGLTLGHGATFALTGYRKLTKYLWCHFRSQCSRIERDYLQYSAGATLGSNIGENTVIKAEVSLDKTVKGVLTKSWEKLRLYLSYQIGLENHVMSIQLIRPLKIRSPADAHIECSAKYDLLDGAHVEYGASKQLTEYSRLAALVRIGHISGVKLKLTLSRGSQSYRFDVIFSDVIEPAAVLYGTFLPVFVYSALHWLVINPYLNRLKAEEIASKSEELKTQLEQSKEEAKEAIQLMRPTYDRNVNVEQCKGGLVIVQAWYGVFGSSNKLIDVTIPLQCLVANSKLMLPEHNKTGLVGFYDVSFGEDKQLAVKYRFRNIMHEVMIEDGESMKIPRQSHRIAQTVSQEGS
ncbi:dnaJ homolog subfamily C member 11-like [Bolinopsis microptera]|uniref:dnaJ homolog subfamily C member 11-like n=1 Tax=Bolinopsis microptera TaxID=2820187 RepID=UPI00307AD045